MKRFYLAGHTNFGNRGNEALARSTLALLKQQFGEVELLVPSYNPKLDGGQWLRHVEDGVRFVPVPKFPESLRWWSRADRFLPAVTKNWFPGYRVPAEIARDVERCDGVIASGGDVITLDYGAAPLLWNIGFLEFFRRQGMPVVVWAASLGPFKKSEQLERFVAGFLRSLPSVSVRETISYEYMRSIGVKDNLELVADPAFVLEAETFDLAPYLPEAAPEGILGLNFSPLIQKFRPAGESPDVLKDELAGFVRDAVQKGFSVLLVPHVGPLGDDVEGNNNDARFLADVLSRVKDLGRRVTSLPDKLNACQLKYAISHCRLFFGARTHSTIAALSKGVPTICIAYSVKAKGLNQDLFGSQRYVVNTPDVSRKTLGQALEILVSESMEVRQILSSKIPTWRVLAGVPAQRVATSREMVRAKQLA